MYHICILPRVLDCILKQAFTLPLSRLFGPGNCRTSCWFYRHGRHKALQTEGIICIQYNYVGPHPWLGINVIPSVYFTEPTSSWGKFYPAGRGLSWSWLSNTQYLYFVLQKLHFRAGCFLNLTLPNVNNKMLLKNGNCLAVMVILFNLN